MPSGKSPRRGADRPAAQLARPAGSRARAQPASPHRSRACRPRPSSVRRRRRRGRTEKIAWWTTRACARAELHGAHPLVLGEPGRNHEVAVDVRPARRNVEAGRHLEDEIRLAELPAVGERRQRAASSPRRRAACPAFTHVADRRDLRVGQAALVRRTRRSRAPPATAACTATASPRDELAALGDVLVRHQRERRRLARPMARRRSSRRRSARSSR